MVVLCPAKVNLYLRVLDRRPDGYHDLDSVLQTIGLFDQLYLRPAEELRFNCDAPSVPTGAENLVLRAAQLLRERFGITRGAEIKLEKAIPVQAGLGGGSSDAAGALIGLCRLWEIEAEGDKLSALAANLGSDVPYFLTGGTAYLSGRGEIVQPLEPLPTGQLVLVKPAFGISTASAYEQLDLVGPSDALAELAPEEFLCHPHNDFERVLFPIYPELAEIRQALLDAGCLAALLCGSGSAVFGLSPGKDQAQVAAAELSSRWPWVRAAATCSHGAMVLGDGD